ncbi:MAG TPA: AVAST type 3 anti-phage protein Avs3b [Steroidobacter sp.]
MTKNEFQQGPDSTFSSQTASSSRSDHVLRLGRRLVQELQLEPSVDTLGRWMAHYLAELIEKAENAAGEDKNSIEKECFDAILKLWQHRAELPDGKRPFEDMEPILRAVETLDPRGETRRYFRSARPPKEEANQPPEVKAWLDMISGLDYSARVLIQYCLAEAARSAVDRSQEWVKLAEAAGADEGPMAVVIRFVSSDSEPDAGAAAREQLEDRIGRLAGFIKLAETMRRDLNARLDKLPPSPRTDDDAPDSKLVLSFVPPFPPKSE